MLAFLYTGVGWLCFVCGHAASQSQEPGKAWYIAAALLVVLGANTLLLLDQLALLVLREMARQQGWYSDRRGLQLPLVGLGLFAGLLLLGWLRTRLDAVWSQCGWAVIGICLLLALAVVRGISFHYVDLVINFRVAGVSVARALELTGLVMALAGAWRWLRVH